MKSIIDLKKKSKIIFIIICLCFCIILGRIFFLQIFDGARLSEMAIQQLYSGRNIGCKRGKILDCTGKNILAQSSTVYTITVNPNNIPKENKEKVAKILTEIFELNYEKVIKSVSKNSSIEYIVKRVDKEKTDELRNWMIENQMLSGINIDEDTKRYYPYSSLASQVIGFCGSENQGLDGIEAKYNDILNGEKGCIEKATDAKGNKFDNIGENYVEPKSGNDIVISIDMTIQSIAEKYLEEVCIDNVCTDGGNVLIMNPKNGDILAMATYPNYDLNKPYEVKSKELSDIWNELTQKEKTMELQKVWRNKAIADTYEPGSCFKLVTASAAIEENITDSDKNGEFNCGGSIEVAGVRIKCWRYYRPHGSQSLRQALMNSCNPVFISLGQKIGVEKYYEYLENFGFLNKTGIDLYGEAKSIFLSKEKVGPVELATISFGQRFEVTPIQMITMVSTIANEGKYIKPRILKSVIDSQTGEENKIQSEFGSQVISTETSKKVLSMMGSVVDEGTGKNAKVQGITVGGKTGTSEDGVNTGKYVTSFIGVAPVENPAVTILVTLYNPTGERRTSSRCMLMEANKKRGIYI